MATRTARPEPRRADPAPVRETAQAATPPAPTASATAPHGALSELHIRGLGAIDDVSLELGPGLTVVTGETGAGKTMVVTGLTLLFGGRADRPVRIARVHASTFGDRLVAKFGLPVRGFRDARHHPGPGHELFTSRNVLTRDVVDGIGTTDSVPSAEVSGAGSHDDA